MSAGPKGPEQGGSPGAMALRAENQGVVEPERLLDELDRACTLLVEVCLMAAGFHRPIHRPGRRQQVHLSDKSLEAYTGLALDDQTIFTLSQWEDRGPAARKRFHELLGKRPEICCVRRPGDSRRDGLGRSDRLQQRQRRGLEGDHSLPGAGPQVQLSGPEPSPLERLLVDRIAVCWLQVCYSDMAASEETESDLPLDEFEIKRLDRAQSRFHRAIRELTSFRKLRRSIRPGPKSRGRSNSMDTSRVSP